MKLPIFATLMTIGLGSASFAMSLDEGKENNQQLRDCLISAGLDTTLPHPQRIDQIDMSSAAACHSEYRAVKREKRYADIRQFLKENPRYRFGGQSLNKCFGKPKRIILDKIEEKANGDVTYYFPKYLKSCDEQ